MNKREQIKSNRDKEKKKIISYKQFMDMQIKRMKGRENMKAAEKELGYKPTEDEAGMQWDKEGRAEKFREEMDKKYIIVNE